MELNDHIYSIDVFMREKEAQCDQYQREKEEMASQLERALDEIRRIEEAAGGDASKAVLNNKGADGYKSFLRDLNAFLLVHTVSPCELLIVLAATLKSIVSCESHAENDDDDDLEQPVDEERLVLDLVHKSCGALEQLRGAELAGRSSGER